MLIYLLLQNIWRWLAAGLQVSFGPCERSERQSQPKAWAKASMDPKTKLVQFSSVTQSCPTLCDLMNPSTPGLPVHHQLTGLLKLMPIESVMPSSHLILCHPLLHLPPIPPSIRVFSNESTLRMRWPKYWSFSFSISPSNEHLGLISFRMEWLDRLAVQGTLKSLLQHHSSKASIFLALSFLHSPTLISIHDHWKNHSLD